ncbi:B-cell linker protein-like isoform X1 [Pimephales promelas]|uniref:B-cell linker protein-like isoform X1 n=1 Tax=Pimephales promelas TaxID=90988 RepID=UPI001955F2A9|nr:B-cell linker protein-like isoform X1 [Pimephales promelas]
MSLPTREQCEGWSPAQVSSFLIQNNMRDCAESVQRYRIDGCRFLTLADGDLNRFSLLHRPQLQKMVQDIKKNDDSLFNRLKRFQNEQTANILKSGRTTLDRIKKKGPPKVPARDYQGEAPDTERYSDSDFDSDTYEDPQGDHEDNYEPPPRSEGHGVKGFTIGSSISNSRGEYVDSCRGRPAKPNTPFLPQQRHKPPRLTRSRTEEDDGDYIEPEGEMEDNYIDPTEKTLTKPAVNRGVKPSVPACGNGPDFYEVPDIKENSQSNKRGKETLQLNTQMAPPKASPRMHARRPSSPEPQSDDDYEVCEGNDRVNERPEETTETRRPSMPTPRPRDLMKPNPASIPASKPSVPRRDSEASSTKTTPVIIPRSPPDTKSSPSPTGIRRARMPLPRQAPAHSRGTLPSEGRSARDAEEEAGVYSKVWFAGSCDRKTAEDALIRLAKDGSFLLRKSSGVDAQQPYTLVVFYNGRVYNIPVRYIASNKQYALGKEKQGEEHFSSVSDMIENHQKNPLVLVDSQSNTKDSTKLRHAVKP